MTQVRVNGAPRRVPERATVAEVVAEVTATTRGVAVAVNGEVVARNRWASTPVTAGDAIEVLTAAQGG